MGWMCRFQPRPTHGGRPSVFYFFIFGVLFQPTPTHGGRLVADRSRKQNLKVSTHAHARWATHRLHGDFYLVVVSTHAHARWATSSLEPRFREIEVSTHAHARWATVEVLVF